MENRSFKARQLRGRGWLVPLGLLLGALLPGRMARAGDCGAALADHAPLTKLLQRFVKDGVVDYAGLKASGAAALSGYLDCVGRVERAEYARWSPRAQLAYWINTYNASVLQLVLDHHPIKSVRKIGLLPGAAFREDFIASRIFGKKVSLNTIEHEVLRKEFAEPRIHFALVCAARSCPALRSEAYRPGELDAQLDDAARTFLRDGRKNRADPAASKVYLSQIFKWYGEDFTRGGKTLAAALAPFSDGALRELLLRPGTQIDFADYDWSLNGR